MRQLLPAVALIAATSVSASDKQLLWGDTHLHTHNSFDAITIGNRTIGPAEAYRYAKGEPVVHPYHRARVQIGEPLDFLVVSDHAEYLGTIRYVYENGVPTDDLGIVDTLYAWLSSAVVNFGISTKYGPLVFGSRLPKSEDPKIAGERVIEEGMPMGGLPPMPDVERSVWKEITDAADEANAPGDFTALIGWEWSSNAGGVNMHRIVITDSGAPEAQQYQPFSFLNSPFPEDLWAWLNDTSASTGADFIAIPHNSNISKGYMFDKKTLRGEDFTPEYIALRAKWETVTETTQIKGDSETHPELSPDDEFADFETFDFYIQQDESPYVVSPGDYVRSALRAGLELQQEFGSNPFQFGMIGSSDAHSGLAGAEEDNFHGKFAADSTPESKQGLVDAGERRTPTGWDMSASGLAAVWAEDNTRESIMRALKRREVYATSGPRIAVRFFAGYDYAEDIFESAEFYSTAAASGVPMGSELASQAETSPEFLLVAEKEADGANLDRMQIVKGWVDSDGRSHEQVYNVAWSGERTLEENGQLAPVGDTVNLSNATYSNTIGTERLQVRWQDPDFEAGQEAFYYARVLQIPTPRHALFDAVAMGKPLPEGTEATLQDRAYTSPIWYRPE
ncbi:DUF3604 domain-containing protein [Halioglobus maricola]|uniref:DUF3604 domain-containing protein n=1 Tax=Halioglobus maricola TaxID=2601894 RepID=A0A5P9NIB8_9GAMM|nr:DUF3604 domain-containing protein [Halioglobus maricola]QFU75289.1 DUF3604 domain-containing protein [Halioglobus maricola]